jgi:hypothetical protein
MSTGQLMCDRAGTHYEQAVGTATSKIPRCQSRHCRSTPCRELMGLKYSFHLP